MGENRTEDTEERNFFFLNHTQDSTRRQVSSQLAFIVLAASQENKSRSRSLTMRQTTHSLPPQAPPAPRSRRGIVRRCVCRRDNRDMRARHRHIPNHQKLTHVTHTRAPTREPRRSCTRRAVASSTTARRAYPSHRTALSSLSPVSSAPREGVCLCPSLPLPYRGVRGPGRGVAGAPRQCRLRPSLG